MLFTHLPTFVKVKAHSGLEYEMTDKLAKDGLDVEQPVIQSTFHAIASHINTRMTKQLTYLGLDAKNTFNNTQFREEASESILY